MKFTCTKENLIKGLNVVSHLASKNISLPILNNVLMEAKNDGIQLSATNLEIGVKNNIRGKVSKDGKITLPARILLSFINLLPEDRVEFELLENNEMQISSGSWQTKIKTQSAEDYPIIPEVEKKESLKIDNKKIRNGLNSVIFASTTNESRPELSGVLFKINKNQLILVATDSYRLAEKKIKLDSEIKKEYDFIVPIKTLQEVVRVLGDFDDSSELEIYWEENQIMFVIENVVLTSRLIDGEYPDYEQIIPKNFNTKVGFNKNEAINAIKATSLFSKVGIYDVSFEFKNSGTMIMKSANNQVGENKAEIKAKVEGEDNQILFNFHYVLDGLNTVLGDDVFLELTNATNPAVLKSEGDESYLYLIMSIRQ